MRVRCLYNTGDALRPFEYESLMKEMLGRFGVTGYSKFGELDLGKQYLVMGVIVFKTYQAYLIDDGRAVSACPCQLFEVLDDRTNPNWHFRIIEKDEDVYPFVQALFGYYELCHDRKSYENLIVEKDEASLRTYFRQKVEYEKMEGNF